MINKNLLLQLANKHDTPLYVYDANQIESNYGEFVNAFDVPKLQVYYACKALSNIHILKLFNEMGSGLDCVSIQEVMLGLHAGFKADDILFTPNNISEEEYDLAIEKGVRINIDNLHMLEYMGRKHSDIPVCIRINPHLSGGGNSKISVGKIDSKFGISIHQVPLIKTITSSYNIKVEGIHVHTGSDILDTDLFIRAAEIVFSVVDEFDDVEFIDFGSGFKVAYKPDDLHTEIASFGKKFSRVFNEYCEKRGKKYVLKFEPGKYFVSNAGNFLAKVNVVKQTTACTFAGVDSGFNHMIRPMFYDAHHQIENISNLEGDKKIYNVVGYICETDTFGINRQLNEVRKHDILNFDNAGAYCFSMASNYNSRYKPAEILVNNGEDRIIRERETFEDLLRGQSFD